MRIKEGGGSTFMHLTPLRQHFMCKIKRLEDLQRPRLQAIGLARMDTLRLRVDGEDGGEPVAGEENRREDPRGPGAHDDYLVIVSLSRRRGSEPRQRSEVRGVDPRVASVVCGFDEDWHLACVRE